MDHVPVSFSERFQSDWFQLSHLIWLLEKQLELIDIQRIAAVASVRVELMRRIPVGFYGAR